MKILACFLLCSMLGGASEVLFDEAKNLFQGRLVRARRELSATATPTQGRASIFFDGEASVEPCQAGKNQTASEFPEGPPGDDASSAMEPLRFEADACK